MLGGEEDKFGKKKKQNRKKIDQKLFVYVEENDHNRWIKKLHSPFVKAGLIGYTIKGFHIFLKKKTISHY